MVDRKQNASWLMLIEDKMLHIDKKQNDSWLIENKMLHGSY